MAIPVINLVNQTASPISLDQLGLVVPASGNINATGPAGSVSVSDLLNDPQLHSQIDAGNISLSIDSVSLTVSQSDFWISPQREFAALKHNLSANTNPTVTDDENNGYSVGSFWSNNTTTTFYRCFSATAGAAAWTVIAQSNVDVSNHASRHLPGGADPLTTAAPSATAVQIGNTAATGTALSFARSDHVHTVTGGTPVNVTKAANAAGTATSFARSDHKHDVTTAAAVAASVGQANAEGTSTSLARADHTHAHAAGTPVNVTKAANTEGVATTFARSDHKHDVTTATAVSVGTVNAEGSATSLARSDHTHVVTGFSIAGQVQGDLLYFNGTSWVRLAPGTAGQVLTTQGAAANPLWAGPKRYPNSATNPLSPTPAAGDTYYNTSLLMTMEYDASRSKWLSMDSVIFQFGRNGDLTPAGTYLRAINGMVMSATLGYDALYNGTVVGISLRRGTSSAANYAVTANGLDIATLAFVSGQGVRTTTSNGDFTAGAVLAGRLVSDAVAPESDVQMFVRVKWRI